MLEIGRCDGRSCSRGRVVRLHIGSDGSVSSRGRSSSVVLLLVLQLIEQTHSAEQSVIPVNGGRGVSKCDGISLGFFAAEARRGQTRVKLWWDGTRFERKLSARSEAALLNGIGR